MTDFHLSKRLETYKESVADLFLIQFNAQDCEILFKKKLNYFVIKKERKDHIDPRF